MLKKLLYFLIFWETETPKNLPHISGKGNPKKLLTFWRMELLSSNSKKFKKSTPRKFLILRENGVF